MGHIAPDIVRPLRFVLPHRKGLRPAIEPIDMVWTHSGVRPLHGDGSANARETTRDYALTLDTAGGAPLLSVFGGKITTYRCLAEDVLDKLAALHPTWAKDAGWTGRTALPGMTSPAMVRRRWR